MRNVLMSTLYMYMLAAAISFVVAIVIKLIFIMIRRFDNATDSTSLKD